MISYAPGTPCWIDLRTPDLEASAAFYGELFGWEVPEPPSSAELGGYRRAKMNGKDVAGMAPLMEKGQPPSWRTYVSVADAAAALATAGAAGGQVVLEAVEVMELGTMGVFVDQTGGECGVWQPGTFAGAELVNEYGTLGWYELGTRDPVAAKQLYGDIFGWSSEERDMGKLGTYIVWRLGETMVGGMFDIRGVVPEDVPAHWLTCFSVEDLDATVARIEAGGGSVRNGPFELPVGGFSSFFDPFGAVFIAIQLTAETRSSTTGGGRA